MPTFGGLLKKKKTKEEEAPSKFSNPQPIQYKQSQPSKPTGNTLSPDNTKQEPISPNAGPVTQVTSTPEPKTDVKSNVNGMNVASLVNPSGGEVHSEASGRSTKGKYTLSDFTMQRTLGTGSFGRVHLVQSKHNNRFYAIKVLKKAQVVKMKQIEHTNDERRMLQRVKHPFLITLWGTFQDSKALFMVMDFIEGGELFSLLRKSQVTTLTTYLIHSTDEAAFP